jgi:hypothetical protein
MWILWYHCHKNVLVWWSCLDDGILLLFNSSLFNFGMGLNYLKCIFTYFITTTQKARFNLLKSQKSSLKILDVYLGKYI